MLRMLDDEQPIVIAWVFQPNAEGKGGGRVELTIDARKLAARLGPRALRSKTGRARYIDGAIIARRVAE